MSPREAAALLDAERNQEVQPDEIVRQLQGAAVAERIPPRTARWKDEYFVCARCGRLFWEGTHWERIRERLRSC